MHLRRAARKHIADDMVESRFDGMAKLLSNDSHFSIILKMAVGNGDSITKSSDVSE